jgi:hypothetical protein
MYQERFGDVLSTVGCLAESGYFGVFENFHGFISYTTVMITAGHLVPFLTTD